MTTVKYNKYTLEITLDRLDRINVTRIDATSSNYMTKLRERTDMRKSLRVLLVKLFERRAITHCNVTFGSKMILTLSKKLPGVRGDLPPTFALRQFQETFSELTGLKIEVDWETDGSPRGRKALFGGALASTRLASWGRSLMPSMLSWMA